MTRPGFDRREALVAAGTLLLAPSTLKAKDLQLDGDDSEIPLFDGRTLSGWHTNPRPISHGKGGRWKVADGVLTGEQDPPGSGNGGLLLSDKKFGNFELTLQLKPDWGICSGVFLRCTEEGAGFQMYVDYHAGGNIGHLLGEMPKPFSMMPFRFNGAFDKHGKLTHLTDAHDRRAENWPPGVYQSSCSPKQFLDAWKVGEWNTARIRCVGGSPRITVWINQLEVCQFNGETCTLPAYDKERVSEILGPRGSIGLQVHGGKDWPRGAKCRWRKIRIREYVSDQLPRPDASD